MKRTASGNSFCSISRSTYCCPVIPLRSRLLACSPGSNTVSPSGIAPERVRAVAGSLIAASVDHDNAALLLQHGGALDLRHHPLHLHLNLAFDADHHALDRHTHLIQLHAALSHFQLDRLHGFGLALAQVDIGLLVAHADLQRLVAHGDLDVAVALFDRNLLVTLLHHFGAIVLDLDGLVVADFQTIVILHYAVEIFLRVKIDFFAALLVFQAQLVEIVGPALQAAAALDAALGLVVGKLVGWHLFGIVHAAHNDGLVRIAFQKIDDHFLADPRNVNDAPLV